MFQHNHTWQTQPRLAKYYEELSKYNPFLDQKIALKIQLHTYLNIKLSRNKYVHTNEFIRTIFEVVLLDGEYIGWWIEYIIITRRIFKSCLKFLSVLLISSPNSTKWIDIHFLDPKSHLVMSYTVGKFICSHLCFHIQIFKSKYHILIMSHNTLWIEKNDYYGTYLFLDCNKMCKSF